MNPFIKDEPTVVIPIGLDCRMKGQRDPYVDLLRNAFLHWESLRK